MKKNLKMCSMVFTTLILARACLAESVNPEWKEMNGPGESFLYTAPTYPPKIKIVEVKWGVYKSWTDKTEVLKKAIETKYRVGSDPEEVVDPAKVEFTNDNYGKSRDGVYNSWMIKMFGKTPVAGTKKSIKLKAEIWGVPFESSYSDGKPVVLDSGDVNYTYPANPKAPNPAEYFANNPKIAVSKDGKTLYLAGAKEGLWKGNFDGTNLSWQKAPGQTFTIKTNIGDKKYSFDAPQRYLDLSTLGNNLWACRYSDQATVMVDPGSGAEFVVNGFAVRVSCNHDDFICAVVNNLRHIYLRKGINENVSTGKVWEKMDGMLQEIAVAPDGMMWGINNHKVFLMKGDRWQEIPVSSSFVKISVSPNGAVWGIDSDGFIFYRYGITKDSPEGVEWKKITGPKLISITAASNGVWGIAVDGKIYFYKSEEVEFAAKGMVDVTIPLNLPKEFRGDPEEERKLRSVAVFCKENGGAAAFVIDSDDNLYKFDTKSFDSSPLVKISDEKFEAVSASQNGSVVGLKKDGYVAKYDSVQKQWVNIEPKLENVQDVAISDSDINGAMVFAISGKSTDMGLFSYNESSKAWQKKEGTEGIVCLSIGKDGCLFGINNDGGVVKYNKAEDGWDDVSDIAVVKMINVSAGAVNQVVALDIDFKVWIFDATANKFVEMQGQEAGQATGVIDLGINAGGWTCFITADGRLFYNEIKGISATTAQPVVVAESRSVAQDTAKIAKRSARGRISARTALASKSNRAASIVSQSKATRTPTRKSALRTVGKPVVAAAFTSVVATPVSTSGAVPTSTTPAVTPIEPVSPAVIPVAESPTVVTPPVADPSVTAAKKIVKKAVQRSLGGSTQRRLGGSTARNPTRKSAIR